MTVLYQQGAQTLYFAPVDALGRPSVASSPTYSIVDLRKGVGSADRTVQASGVATIGSASQTTSAAAGPGQSDPTRIAVPAVTGFTAGRRYLITASDGQREDFYLARLDSGTPKYLYAATALSRTYASGATVRAYELEGTFPSGEASDEPDLKSGGGPYQVTWSYTIGADLYLTPQTVWVARYTPEPWITPADVAMVYPTLPGRMRDLASISSAIRCATDDWLADLAVAGRDVASYRPGEPARVAVRSKAVEYCLRWLGSDSESQQREIDRLAARYQELRDSQLTGRPPRGTVETSPADDTLLAGANAMYGHHFILPE